MRLSPKFLADILTGSRLIVAIWLLVLAWQADRSTLPWVVGVVVLAWSGDMVDGALARRGGRSPLRGIGEYDHLIDASLAGATLLYLWRIHLVPVGLLLIMGALTAFVWYKMRSDWAWMGFSTGSHLVALTALLAAFPALVGVVLGWGAMVALAGRKRTVQMLGDVRELISRPFHGRK